MSNQENKPMTISEIIERLQSIQYVYDDAFPVGMIFKDDDAEGGMRFEPVCSIFLYEDMDDGHARRVELYPRDSLWDYSKGD